MNITIIGTGFVGVVSAAVYASFGHQVTGLDIDQNKVDQLRQGQVPFYEPKLKKMLLKQQKTGNLSFTTDYQQAISNSKLVIISVGTPSKANNEADLSAVFAASKALAPHLEAGAIVAVKSTVPPGTLDKVEALIDEETDVNYYTASLPEFLKEGSAVEDTLHPDRILIGATADVAFDKLEKLHQPLKAPIIKMSPESAQMAKYSANAYLATRITFINQIANLCQQNGANIEEVITGIGYDQRIGHHYWYPGFGYGGSCFPKDVKELAAYSHKVGQDSNLMVTINKLNEQRIPRLLKLYQRQFNGWQDKTVAVLGLSFKPNTDDTRQAPATKVVPWLLEHGAQIKAYDPMATWAPEETKLKATENRKPAYQQVATIETAVNQAEVVMALIEWPEITEFDFASQKTRQKKDDTDSAADNSCKKQKRYFIDARNQFEPDIIRRAGYQYIGIGRS